jgi:hypothetical protein
MTICVFLNVFNSTLLQQKNEYEINFIMKIKGPFMKIMLLNEDVKHPLFKPKFEIGRSFNSF